MRRKVDIELKAGIFVFSGLVIVLVTIALMGGGNSLFESYYKLQFKVPDTGGLSKGAVVKSGGLAVGRVNDISFSQSFDSVNVSLIINKKFQDRFRKDSSVRFLTQGVLGDKFVEISGGSPQSQILSDGDYLDVETSKDLTSILSDGSSAVELLKENLANLKIITSAMAKKNQMDSIMSNLKETSDNLKDLTSQFKQANFSKELSETMKNLKVVTEKVKNGEGTVGALLSDASLYEDLKNLIGGANRNTVLKFFVRQAVKSSDDAQIEKINKLDEKKQQEAVEQTNTKGPASVVK
ncbi:MAG: MlaD family protein [Oligoflexia bacterium]|nr:MlaD family protein [Oligoflexia bacterium]